MKGPAQGHTAWKKALGPMTPISSSFSCVTTPEGQESALCPLDNLALGKLSRQKREGVTGSLGTIGTGRRQQQGGGRGVWTRTAREAGPCSSVLDTPAPAPAGPGLPRRPLRSLLCCSLFFPHPIFRASGWTPHSSPSPHGEWSVRSRLGP